VSSQSKTVRAQQKSSLGTYEAKEEPSMMISNGLNESPMNMMQAINMNNKPKSSRMII
jgi:hypothetical protein